jgi:hypothetical protein
MKVIGKTILALGLTAAMAGGSLAQDLDPTGVWVAEENSDYSVSWCGADNRSLCVQLVGLRGNMRKPRNLEYLNSTIIKGAKPAGANLWKGKMSVFGVTGDAIVTMRADNDLHVKLCAYIVICDEYEMTRVE